MLDTLSNFYEEFLSELREHHRTFDDRFQVERLFTVGQIAEYLDNQLVVRPGDVMVIDDVSMLFRLGFAREPNDDEYRVLRDGIGEFMMRLRWLARDNMCTVIAVNQMTLKRSANGTMQYWSPVYHDIWLGYVDAALTVYDDTADDGDERRRNQVVMLYKGCRWITPRRATI